MKDLWRPVEGWPYEVSNTGSVRNKRTGRVLKLNPHKSGYLQVQLWHSQKYKTFLVSRLVAHAFLGTPPTVDHEAAHIDGDWHNNRSTNLRWATHAEIMRSREINGNTARGDRNGKTKHSDATVLSARRLRDEGKTHPEIGQALGIPAVTSCNYTRRKRREQVRA